MLWPKTINKHHLTTIWPPKSIKKHQKRSKIIKKHQKTSTNINMVFIDQIWCFMMFCGPVVWSLLLFFDVFWCFLMFFDVFCSFFQNSKKCLSDHPPWYQNHQKTSKTTKNHQKTSTNIKKHQQTSKKTIWCFQVIWSFVVFSDSGRLIFGGRFCWSFLMFVDVFWCFLMFFDVFWSILVVKWWSGENRKGSIGPSSML